MKKKHIVFFMLVTNKDVLIAHYAIKSYLKIYNSSKLPPDHFTLFIYANCLSEENKLKYFAEWQKLPYVEIFDNSIKVTGKRFVKLEKILSPEGVEVVRPQENEYCDEVWSTELQKFATPYYATVDADFEILRKDFYLYMMDELEKEENLVAYSTDYSPTQKIFDTYSISEMILSERWHTWFCIYKEKTKRCQTSHFFYEYLQPDGMKFSFDSSGHFQQKLIKDFGYTLKALPPQYQSNYIHYGAFAENVSINSSNIKSYRWLAIASMIGISSSAVFQQTIIGKLVNKAYKKFARKIYNKLYGSANEERRYFT